VLTCSTRAVSRMPLPLNHIDNLVFDVRRLAGVGIAEQEGAALAGLLPAAVALLALRTLAVSDNIDSITIGTVEHPGHHDSLIKVGGVILQQRISDPQFYNTFQMGCHRTFSSVGPTYGTQPVTMFICGDDPEAKATVGSLAAELGFEVIDSGPLLTARYLEPLAMLWIHLAYVQGLGPDFAFKVIRRS
jgi:hypothetical protein